jgi:hypothetical protein
VLVINSKEQLLTFIRHAYLEFLSQFNGHI